MGSRLALLAALLGTAICPALQADGKFYHVDEDVPAGVPYQRAFIIEEDTGETLILQSRYDAGKTGVAGAVGWVVPLPEVPELASMPADTAHAMFSHLAFHTGPHVVTCGEYIWATLGVLLVAIGGLLVVRHHGGAGVALGICGLLILFVLVGSASLGSAGSDGVEVVSEESVGVYDAQVVRASAPEDLIAWLRENGLAYEEADREAFQGYIDRGWRFVVAKVAPDADTADAAYDGLAAPLIMRFETDRLVYPLVLTSLAGGETEVLLYTFSRHRLTCDDRMDLAVAQERDDLWTMFTWPEGGHLSSAHVDPPTFFPEVDTSVYRDEMRNAEGPFKPRYLCKFRGTLKPKQMRTDLYFENAEVDENYREHVWRW